MSNSELYEHIESSAEINQDNYLKNFTENTQDWDDDDFYSNIINDKIENIRNSNNWGNIPNYAQERILATLKPKLNYRAILRNFKASIISSKRTLTRMKPNRRYGFDYMGSKYEYSSKLLFAVDVSGSMDHRTLMNGFSIISNIFNYGVERIDVIEFDTEVKGKKRELKKAFKEIKITGRGGTAFQPIFDYIEENNIYDGLVIFTDGYAPTPKLSKKIKAKIVWLFNNEKNYNAIKNKLSGLGLAMYITPE
jgi:predicted metal-dependent peptidase